MNNGFTVIEGTTKDYTDLSQEEIERFKSLTDEEVDNLPLDEYKRYLWYANMVFKNDSERERKIFNKLANTPGETYEKLARRNLQGYQPKSKFEAKQIDKLEELLLS